MKSIKESPFHVAIIMDGNRRWAFEHSLDISSGYQKGIDTAFKIVSHAHILGVTHMTLFALSTENWNRDNNLLDCIFKLFAQSFDKKIEDLKKQNIKVDFIGKIDRLPKEVKDRVIITKKTNQFTAKMHLKIAISYGGRQDILHAVKKILKDKRCANEIDETVISDSLYTYGTPDPDLVIRTGGNKRLSNFLLWQMAYSELYFSDKLWPDFCIKDFEDAMEDYKKRKRKYGK